MNETQDNLGVLRAVVRTLDSITVSGRDNMSRLLGCITAMEEYIEKEENNG